MAISASGDQLGLSVLIVDDVIFLALAGVAVCARLLARYIPKRKLCFNDNVINLVLMFAGERKTTANMAVVTGGAGQHMDKVQLSARFYGYAAAEIFWVKKPDAKRSGGFGKLDDAHPLTGITDVINVVSQAEGPDRPNKQQESESRDLEAQDNHGKSSSARRLGVRKDWAVHSVHSQK
ncbi:32303618-ccc5-4ce3-9f8b-ea0c7bfaaf65 [Sclerotinia trifoliorum]|uniref:32303618-ccc5-4ce3-9f8b-ea0c7bfaaf65 n=1 Tax=Sclerotinia trifoliorum TaxID=28548 RepID=A0A8H2VMH1_9HELO|nr:32303618-ccc5-4ce3-9f8b-ea0c7bfaaf65 [Sclerotinia trifoliorum]